MGYLDDLLGSVQETDSRNSRRRSSIKDLLYAVAPTVQAATPAPGATARGPHSMSDGHNHASQSTVNGLNAQFNDSLQRLIKDSGGKVKIGSGYRSIAEQAKLYDRWMRKVPGQAPAAKPGKSNHNFGTAADLTFTDAEARKWVHANAANYGLFFPMSYEPWHIEPISNRSKYKKK